MKYTLKMSKVSDPLFSPWDIVVEDTKHPNVLTVQDPHPLAGDNLIGFEDGFEDMKATVHDYGWEEMSIGRHPVFAGKHGEEGSGMYSIQDLTVREVHNHAHS